MRNRLIISFIFFIPLMYVSMGHMIGLPLPGFLTGTENAIAFAMTQLLLAVPVIYVNRKFYYVGFKNPLQGFPEYGFPHRHRLHGRPGLWHFCHLPHGVWTGRGGYGAGGTLSYDLYFESAATILTLITLGKYLETRSKGKTSEAITKLMNLAPKTAMVEREGREVEIPVEEVVVGDIVYVRPGASVP